MAVTKVATRRQLAGLRQWPPRIYRIPAAEHIPEFKAIFDWIQGYLNNTVALFALREAKSEAAPDLNNLSGHAGGEVDPFSGQTGLKKQLLDTVNNAGKMVDNLNSKIHRLNAALGKLDASATKVAFNGSEFARGLPEAKRRIGDHVDDFNYLANEWEKIIEKQFSRQGMNPDEAGLQSYDKAQRHTARESLVKASKDLMIGVDEEVGRVTNLADGTAKSISQEKPGAGTTNGTSGGAGTDDPRDPRYPVPTDGRSNSLLAPPTVPPAFGLPSWFTSGTEAAENTTKANANTFSPLQPSAAWPGTPGDTDSAAQLLLGNASPSPGGEDSAATFNERFAPVDSGSPPGRRTAEMPAADRNTISGGQVGGNGEAKPKQDFDSYLENVEDPNFKKAVTQYRDSGGKMDWDMSAGPGPNMLRMVDKIYPASNTDAADAAQSLLNQTYALQAIRIANPSDFGNWETTPPYSALEYSEINPDVAKKIKDVLSKYPNFPDPDVYQNAVSELTTALQASQRQAH